MADKLETSINSLEERLKALKNRKSKRDAQRRTVANRQKRSDDTRRKILVGAITLAKVDQGVLPEETLLQWLDAALERPDDRALFEKLDRPAADPPPTTA